MKRILVVDDDRAWCKMMSDLLNSQGWSAEAVTTPDEALRSMSKEKFDLLISDINLEADQNGIDLLRRARDQCPVILMTGFGTLDTTVAASREGAWDIVSKPFKVQEFISTVRRALEREETGGAEATPDPRRITKAAGSSVALLPCSNSIKRSPTSRRRVRRFC